ncbi:hypothetical protein BABINDRAFT_161062 [Babjeviella inositovora NRRL Y-12698]|uniref:Ureidoglycolate lyase n=1 Tax=Babjeviella inositovora NRRL Y-12698 TaxID=984486 RepID=A0A1E3QT94_9ASCO|nr:uncharacterized protein BABINDRAFT_161062 [Babjeviella inositovora NRRL Y-12698]ODQ80868.1 hypothetical protein BABINDRAFT_161062 [Babjeviella inositovora NRRL Y-12698]
MVLSTFDVSKIAVITAKPITPENFALYGSLLSANEQIEIAARNSKGQGSSLANYGTAIKLHKVSHIANNYAQCPLGAPATANWNIFRCSPPNHLIDFKSSTSGRYTCKVLERHPFSTQTFLPLGRPAAGIAYLVIVARTDVSTGQRLPDPETVEAFIVRGDQAVTYGMGTWHAPMVALGETHTDFGVLIHENGVEDEDCQECYFENPGYTIEFESKSRPLCL